MTYVTMCNCNLHAYNMNHITVRISERLLRISCIKSVAFATIHWIIPSILYRNRPDSEFCHYRVEIRTSIKGSDANKNGVILLQRHTSKLKIIEYKNHTIHISSDFTYVSQ